MRDEAIETCSNGHPWTPANTRWESSGRGKHKRRRCRQCLRDKAAKRIESYDYTTANSIPDHVRYAKPSHVRRALKDFDAAQEHVTAKCAASPNPGLWTDGWEDAEGELQPELIPSPEMARELCKGCPLLDSCRKAAEGSLPGIGVWGGEVWIYGEKYYGGTKNVTPAEG